MITDETIERLDNLRIGEQYVGGKSTTELQKEYKLSWNTLHQYFIVRGIPTRPAKRRKSSRPKAPIGAKFGLWTVVSEEAKAGNELKKKRVPKIEPCIGFVNVFVVIYPGKIQLNLRMGQVQDVRGVETSLILKMDTLLTQMLLLNINIIRPFIIYLIGYIEEENLNYPLIYH